MQLVENVGCGQVAMPPLLARLAEETVHLASHLARDAQRGTFAIGNEDRLNEMPGARGILRGVWGVLREDGEQILHRAIHAALAVGRKHRAHRVVFGQPLAVLLRQIGHLVDAGNVLLVEPLRHLSAREGGHTKTSCHLFQFSKGHAQQRFLNRFHSACFRFMVQSYCKKMRKPSFHLIYFPMSARYFIIIRYCEVGFFVVPLQRNWQRKRCYRVLNVCLCQGFC